MVHHRFSCMPTWDCCRCCCWSCCCCNRTCAAAAEEEEEAAEEEEEVVEGAGEPGMVRKAGLLLLRLSM